MCDIYFNGKVLGEILTELGYKHFSHFENAAGIGRNTVCGLIKSNSRSMRFSTRKKVIDSLDMLNPDWKETSAYKAYIDMKNNPKFDKMTPESLKKLLDETGETQTHFGAMCGISQVTISTYLSGKHVKHSTYKAMCVVYDDIKKRKSNAESVQIHAEYPVEDDFNDYDEIHLDNDADETAKLPVYSSVGLTDEQQKMIDIVCTIKGITRDEYLLQCVMQVTEMFIEKMKGAIK